MELNNVEQSRDEVVIFINDKLRHMAPFVPECSIHRVPKQLLDMNRNAYVPRVISIGPFHRDQHKFNDTEELKIRFFNSYQCRVGLSVENIVKKARGWEIEARQNYSTTIDMNSEEFVKMMVLDGCFIIELMIMGMANTFPINENKVYYSSFFSAIELNMRVELLMLENQLPYFVLQRLFNLVYSARSKTANFSSSYGKIELFEKVVHNFLKLCMLSFKNMVLEKSRLYRRPCHLLDYLSSYFVPKMDEKMWDKTFVRKKFLPPSATQLNEADIVFKKVGKPSIMEISFEKGILSISPLEIDDAFETYARNLLAFAQFSREKNGWYIIHYFEFLDELITTEKDVNLLVKDGIIINCIGGNEKEIAKLFNNICKNITVGETSYLSDIANSLKQHCDIKQNRWMASLKHNHFRTPWTIISILAAIFPILLTLLQTIFTGMSTFK